MNLFDPQSGENEPPKIDPQFVKWASLAPVAVTVGDAAGQCVYANERCCRLTGRSLDEMLGLKWVNALHPEDRDRVFEQWQSHVDAKTRFREEYRILRPDGSVKWVLAEITDVTDDSGSVASFIGVLIDISTLKQLQGDQQRLEVELAETRRLESLAAMAGEVAHDFNNMLVGILGGASLALMELQANSPLRETLEMIEQTALAASERTSQLLAFAGRVRTSLTLLDINGLIKNAASSLESIVGRRARLQFFLNHSLPEIQADSAQLRHILNNLVSNAAEAMSEPGGEITVTTGFVEAAPELWSGAVVRPVESDCSHYLFIEVKDSGVGMSDSVRLQAFTPFFSTREHGRGLGLPAVAGIVRSHKGGLILTSSPGRGAAVRVYLPCPECAGHSPEVTESADAAKVWIPRPCVLVADDEESVRAVVRQILEREGFAVLLAKDGQEAVELFNVHHEGLAAVLLDLTMPILNGEQAFLRMREINPDVPVVLFSGYSEQDALSRFKERGLAGFLQKPFRPRELLACFKEILPSNS